MDRKKTGPAPALSQRDADILGRQFNSALMNATAYGVEHSVSQRACTTFRSSLLPHLQSHDSLTLLFDRGTLFFEDYSLEGKFTATRIERTFRARGIQSLTFLPGVAASDLQVLMQMLLADEQQSGLEQIRAELESRGIQSLRINHVLMRKFTADDEVIDRQGLEQLTELAERGVSAGPGASAAATPGLSLDLMERVENIFSMKALLQDPDQVGQALIEGADVAPEDVVAGLRGLRRELGQHSDADADTSVSLQQVMTAVNRVRAELTDAMASQNEIARFLTESGGEVIDEVDRLTYDTVTMIVSGEFRSGTTSVKRLAQITRRILPEARDIKRILPQLRKALSAEGMAVSAWISFVHELAGELKSDEFAALFEKGAEGAGVSPEELMRDLREDPEEAARLLVLAAELRRSGAPAGQALSRMLSEQLGQPEDDSAPDAQESAQSNLAELLRQAEQKLHARGQEPARLHKPADHDAGSHAESLQDVLDEPLDRMRVRAVVERMRSDEAPDERQLAESLFDLFDQDTDFRRLEQTLAGELTRIGFSAEVLGRVFEQTERRLKSRSRLELLPEGMLEPNVLNYLLEREIASCRRFGSYFSCILLMIARIRPRNEPVRFETDPAEPEFDEPELVELAELAELESTAWRSPASAETDLLLPQLLRALPPHVRDIDLLGSLGDRERNIPLLLLTMADQSGASIALNRMLEALGREEFELQGRPVAIDLVGAGEKFDFEHHHDRRSYLRMLQTRLAEELIARLRRPRQSS